jgi:hypothetical protein
MSFTDLSSIPAEVLATELYNRVNPKSRVVVVGSNIDDLNSIVRSGSDGPRSPLVNGNGVFVVLNTHRNGGVESNTRTHLTPQNLGPYIEIVPSQSGRRRIPRVRKEVEKELRKHPQVFSVGFVPGPIYLVAVDVYTSDPEIHKQIVRTINGNINQFVFRLKRRTTGKMTLQHSYGICSSKLGAHTPDGTVSFRIHFQEIPELDNAAGYRYASNFHVFATQLGDISHGGLINVSKNPGLLQDVRMAVPCHGIAGVLSLGTPHCQYRYRFDGGEYTRSNDIAFTNSIKSPEEAKYETCFNGSITDIDAILFETALGNIMDTDLFEIHIETNRGIIKGHYMGIVNYEQAASDGSDSDHSSSGLSLSTNKVINQPVSVSSGSLRPLDQSRQSSSSSQSSMDSSIDGDELKLVDHILIATDADNSTNHGDSGSPVYIVRKAELDVKYLIGVHRSRHNENTYAVPLGAILDYFTNHFMGTNGDNNGTHVWTLSSAKD